MHDDLDEAEWGPIGRSPNVPPGGGVVIGLTASVLLFWCPLGLVLCWR